MARKSLIAVVSERVRRDKKKSIICGSFNAFHNMDWRTFQPNDWSVWNIFTIR